jgi:hypothetical protein
MGGRYRMLVPMKGPSANADLGPHEAVLEFVTFFYEFVRDDAQMVRKLDLALKERYGVR